MSATANASGKVNFMDAIEWNFWSGRVDQRRPGALHWIDSGSEWVTRHGSGWMFNLLRSRQACAYLHVGLPPGQIEANRPYRAGLRASPFSFSNASGIIWPNIELSIAVGIRPALLLSWADPPDIRNCGTRGWLMRVRASANLAKFCSASLNSGPP